MTHQPAIPTIALLSECRAICPCDICRFPIELQEKICFDFSFAEFALLRLVSQCWSLRSQIFGPGKGTIAFGYNSHGQLGDGKTISRYHPTFIKMDLQPQQIAVGFCHALALTAQGEVHGWGSNRHGQLGVGQRWRERLYPARVAGLRHVVQVECGNFHSFALTAQGEMYAWGDNQYGQLGNGRRGRSDLPTLILSPLRLVQISAGHNHTLGLTSTGEVYGWGANDFKQLGDGPEMYLCPVKMETLPSNERVVRVVAGVLSSYALTDQGHLYAWGCSFDGRLGDGSDTLQSGPQRVPLPHRIVYMEAADHVLVLTDQGEVYAWGRNDYGQVGDGSRSHRDSPARVELRRATQIAAGSNYSLAVTDQGEIFGWGRNHVGHLGDGTKVDRLTPVRLPCSAVGHARNLRIAAVEATFVWAT